MMRLRFCPLLFLVFAGLPLAASAQNQPASTVRTLLAAGRIGSVVDTPLKLRLLSIHLPAAQHVSYSGPNAMLYALSGGVGADFDGNTQPVTEGAGAFVPASKAATFSASGSDSAHLLLFVLSPAAEAQKPLIGTPAAVEELYRSAEPLPDLQAGPYEFSLTRVSLPPGMPANPPHYRSGAALYYLIAGSGRFTAESKTEPRTARMAHFEPHGLVHSWANPGDSPLVLLQANISQEGIPAVIPATAK